MIEQLLEDADAAYLEHLLLAALEGPRAASSASAGRFVAALFVALSKAGDETVIEDHLLPGASADSDFEIKCWTAGERVPSRSITGLSAVGAVRIAVNLARQSDEALEVVGHDTSGRPHCVLTRAAAGPLEYRFPESPRPRTRPSGTALEQKAPPIPPSSSRHSEDLLEAVRGRLARLPDAEEVSQIVQRVLGEMTVEVDLKGVTGEEGSEGGPAQPPPGTGTRRQLNPVEVADEVVRLLIDRRRAPSAAEIAETVSRSAPAPQPGQPTSGLALSGELREIRTGVDRLVEHLYAETSTLANAVRMVVSSLGDLTTKVDYTEERLLSRVQRLEHDIQEQPAALPQAGSPAGPP